MMICSGAKEYLETWMNKTWFFKDSIRTLSSETLKKILFNNKIK